MKKIFLILSVFLLVVSLNSLVFAACSPGSSWTAAWTDSFIQTTYSLQAPCTAYVDVPFDIIATATDNLYANNDVGGLWSIKDNGIVIAGGGFNWITTINGHWQRDIWQTYTGSPMDHSIEFKCTDFGQGSGGHNWVTAIIGGITVVSLSANTPPTVDAGSNIYFTSENQNTTTIQGIASDADGDSLFYRWLEGTTELQSSQAVDAFGNAPLNLAALSKLSIGAHTFVLEVSDGKTTVTDSVIVSVENSAPVAAPSAGGTFQIGQDIRLNGSVADYDGDTLSYRWLEGATVLATGTIASISGGAPVTLPEQVITGGLQLGTHTLTLEVTDGIHNVAAYTTVNVIDTAAPSLTPDASANILWPPNGTLTTVTINANAHDNSGEPVLLSVLVTSNEPSQTDKDGNLIPDSYVINIDQTTGVITLQLRAARLGNGGDRLYSVTIIAADGSGNSSTSEVIVRAPHDMGHR
jgi:hypothetical protein